MFVALIFCFDKLGRHAWTSELPLFHDEIVADVYQFTDLSSVSHDRK